MLLSRLIHNSYKTETLFEYIETRYRKFFSKENECDTSLNWGKQSKGLELGTSMFLQHVIRLFGFTEIIHDASLMSAVNFTHANTKATQAFKTDSHLTNRSTVTTTNVIDKCCTNQVDNSTEVHCRTEY